MPTVKKRNHNGADEPRTKVPRINGKHVHVHVATYSFLQSKKVQCNYLGTLSFILEGLV